MAHRNVNIDDRNNNISPVVNDRKTPKKAAPQIPDLSLSEIEQDVSNYIETRAPVKPKLTPKTTPRQLRKEQPPPPPQLNSSPLNPSLSDHGSGRTQIKKKESGKITISFYINFLIL